MKKYLLLLFIVLLVSYSTVPTSFAEKDSLSGRVGIGFISINSSNNLNPNGSQKLIDDLQSAAEKESTFIPMLLPSATWDVGEENGVKLFFDTEPPMDEVGGFVFHLGASHPIPETAIIRLGAFFTPFDEVWKDPYITGTPRESSDTSKYGLRLAVNRIMGTGLRVNLVYMNDDVEDDIIGQLIPQMARDGEIYLINANYSFYPSRTFEIRPQLSFRKGKYDGESSSFNKYKMTLKAKYITGKWVFNPELFYSYKEHDDIDQVFQEERENNSYGASVMVNYLAPLNYKDWSISGLLGYSRGDSSITFYDTEAITLGLFLSYSF